MPTGKDINYTAMYLEDAKTIEAWYKAVVLPFVHRENFEIANKDGKLIDVSSYQVKEEAIVMDGIAINSNWEYDLNILIKETHPEDQRRQQNLRNEIDKINQSKPNCNFLKICTSCIGSEPNSNPPSKKDVATATAFLLLIPASIYLCWWKVPEIIKKPADRENIMSWIGLAITILVALCARHYCRKYKKCEKEQDYPVCSVGTRLEA